MNEWLEFDVHGRCHMRCATNAPTAMQLRDMFAPFLTTRPGPADVTVTATRAPLETPSHGEHDYRFNDRGVFINAMGVQIEHVGSEWIASSSREMLTVVVPLVDRVVVERGAAMVHAATFEVKGRGVCMGAWGGVGKTSTVARLLELDDVALMGDDWAFLSDDAQLLGYAKPMFIKPHHRPIYPHLFAAKQKPMVPSRISKPVGRLTTLVHPLATRYPRVARAARRFTPEYMQVTPRQAFPNARIAEKATLDLLVFVERYDGSKTLLEERSSGWMTTRLVGNFHVELSKGSQDVMLALGACDMLPAGQFFSEKHAVVASAIGDKPCYLLRVPAEMSADEASNDIVDHIQKALSDVALI